jgi:hypothetical protein
MATKSKQPSTAGNVKARSGGGLTSNKLVRPGIKSGSRNLKAVPPTHASHIGRSVGNHGMDGDMKRPPTPGPVAKRDFVPMGNQLVNNVGKGGPGTGRILHGKSGTQTQYGPANPGVQGGSPFLPGGSGGPGSFGFDGRGKVVKGWA